MLMAQLGEGTCASNAGLAGAITQAGKYPELIGEIYGAVHGIPGILREQFIDFLEEKQQTLKGLRHTPGAALGTGSAPLGPEGDPAAARQNLDRLFAVFEQHSIRYFFVVGDRIAQQAASHIHQAARDRGYELRLIGIPASARNELAWTDHSPGYGSALKHAATTVREVGLETAATGAGHCCVIETTSRESGWLAAGTVLAKRTPDEAPHFILIPEVPVNVESFLEQVLATVERLGSCVIVTAEGVHDTAGNALATDTAGNPVNAGMAVAHFIRTRLGLPVSRVILGASQRSAGHFASATDLAEAFDCGRDAVRSAVNGQTGFMIKLMIGSSGSAKAEIGLELLDRVADAANPIPGELLDGSRFMPNERFVRKVSPLVEGEVPLPIVGGLPDYVRLERVPVAIEPVTPTAPAPEPAPAPPAQTAEAAPAPAPAPEPTSETAGKASPA